MKKILNVYLVVFSLFLNFSAFAETKEVLGKGEVVSSDPLYNRITIKHDVIKDLGAAGENEYNASAEIIRNLSRRDLVDFTANVDSAGTVEITKIEKTGEAPEEPSGLPVGKAVQGALEATAGAAQAVTSPLPPAHEVVSATTDATTNATGAVLDDATTEVKSKF